MDLLEYPFDAALVLQKKRAIKRELLTKTNWIEKKIAIVGGSTLGEIKNILELFLLEAGIKPTFYEGEYGLFYEDVVFDDGSLKNFAPDLLYIHTSNHNLRHWPHPADSPQQAEDKLEAEFSHFEKVWQAAEKLGCPVIQNNFEPPLWRNFGNLDLWDPRGRVHHVNALNTRMAAYAAAHPNFYIHDLAYLASLHGVDNWCDKAAWYAYKYCCAVGMIPYLAHSLTCLIKSLFGKIKKAVVTDLDNTLWGGIIGECGPDAIELGDETPAGMAFAEYQHYLRTLAGRGILLAVASKNEVEAAESGFTRADSPLKREDFLCFEANWGPKSQSISKIAQALNILPDSLVFTDDNPAEREQVRQQLPEVAIPPFGEPENSVTLLDRAGYFEVSSLSGDDLKRGEMYRQNAQRQKEEESFADYDSYLKSLEMTAVIAPFAPAQLERITQLINKTNQFNLTTRRYSPAETQQAMEDKATITLSGHLVDKFGDNGITSVIIGKADGTVLDIELWIMSCRVFKRHLEYAMFDALVAAAKAKGVTTLTGRYLPTPKNLLVKDFYATIGFDLVEETDGSRRFSYTIPENYKPMNSVIKVDNKNG